MSDFIDKLKVLNEKKDEIIKQIMGINTEGFGKTQAQNLRAYAIQTESIDEILLYIDYQCVREEKKNRDRFKKICESLKKVINAHKAEGIVVIRYMLGSFARWAMIENLKGE